MTRYGSVIRLKPDKVNMYKSLHRKVWPQVQKVITRCNIRNYTIFFRDNWLFSYFEYVGDNYEEDMRKMASDAKTLEWWDLCMPCQEPLENRDPKEWWAIMEEVYHQD
ncbi:MAG: L-rhamnose mutarotase [Firmicutes bacterium]|nr:L-rhamnose mutarotase [Bacillota bacterium]